MANVGKDLIFCPLKPKVTVSVLDEALEFSSPLRGVSALFAEAFA